MKRSLVVGWNWARQSNPSKPKIQKLLYRDFATLILLFHQKNKLLFIERTLYTSPEGRFLQNGILGQHKYKQRQSRIPIDKDFGLCFYQRVWTALSKV